MIGFPKYLNTKEDYLYGRDNFPKNQWEPEFQKLLDNKAWINTDMLKDGDTGLTDNTHRVETVEEQKYQYEFMTDPNCKLFRIGFTEDEVRQILDNAQ